MASLRKPRRQRRRKKMLEAEHLPMIKHSRVKFAEIPNYHKATRTVRPLGSAARTRKHTGAEGGHSIEAVAKNMGRPAVRVTRYEDMSVGISGGGRKRRGVANTGEAGRDKTVTGGPRVRVFGPASSRRVSGGKPAGKPRERQTVQHTYRAEKRSPAPAAPKAVKKTRKRPTTKYRTARHSI